MKITVDTSSRDELNDSIFGKLWETKFRKSHVIYEMSSEYIPTKLHFDIFWNLSTSFLFSCTVFSWSILRRCEMRTVNIFRLQRIIIKHMNYVSTYSLILHYHCNYGLIVKQQTLLGTLIGHS